MKRPRLPSPELTQSSLCFLSTESVNNISSSLRKEELFLTSFSTALRKKKLGLGESCVVCNKGIMTHNTVKLYPEPVTLIEAAERIKKSTEEKKKTIMNR